MPSPHDMIVSPLHPNELPSSLPLHYAPCGLQPLRLTSDLRSSHMFLLPPIPAPPALLLVLSPLTVFRALVQGRV